MGTTKFVSGGLEIVTRSYVVFCDPTEEGRFCGLLAAEKIKEERRSRRHIIKWLIDVLIFPARHGLAVKGADEIIAFAHNGV